MSTTKIKSISMGSVYAVNYEESFKFYNGLLGLDDVMQMGNSACYFKISEDQGIYLAGGSILAENSYETSKISFTLDVESAFEMFKKLKTAGIKIVQEEPKQMGDNIYWFQCYDPSGNIVEFLGGK